MPSQIPTDTSLQQESSDSDRDHAGLPTLTKRLSKGEEPQVKEASSSPTALPTRHPDFWFHDGSIILQVETKLFKIHQTILANHSEIFAGLFDMPPPPPSPPLGSETDSGDQVLEGCRVIVLSGDSEKDMEDLLRAVYDPSYFEDNFSSIVDMDAVLTFVSGILRLSTKYLIRSLRVRCIGILATRLPATFEEYHIRSSGSSSKAPSSSRRNGSPPQPTHVPSTTSLHTMYSAYTMSPSPSQSPDVVVTKQRFRSDTIMRAISLAHETNVLQVLPYLYYCASRISLHRLLKEREGDISWRLKAILLAGRERLRYAELSLSYSFLCVFQRAPQCNGGISCAHTRGPENEWRIVQCSKAPNPMKLYTGWDRLGVCRDCVEYNKGLHEAGRREVWERLPGLFELPKWEELWKLQSM